MKVTKHNSVRKLESISKLKDNAEIRDRIRAVIYAMKGQTAPWIADKLGYSRRWAQSWVQRYNENGLDGLRDLPRSGQPVKLSEEQMLWLQHRIEAGPLPMDKCNVFRGEDIVEMIEKQFGVAYSLSGVYLILSRLGYSYIKPRPLHPKNNPEEMALWLKKIMPNFIRKTKRNHPDKKVEVWFQDEARFGQKGRVVYEWASRGSRPRQFKQGGFKSAYVFGAVNPESGESVGIIFPTCNTTIMNIHLREISRKVGNERHAVVVLDQASWHRAKMLKIPSNISLLQLPPYSPELNPVERLWLWMKDHYLSNKIFEDDNDLLREGCRAWKSLNRKIIKSVCRTSWLKRVN